MDIQKYMSKNLISLKNLISFIFFLIAVVKSIKDIEVYIFLYIFI